ncbi:hypothetical protein [Rosistilla oblonga]|uniref:hypothetical protein n=1 Tax=Rosistilla oblonga TaxID=2527990 RepID=UPI003A98494C
MDKRYINTIKSAVDATVVLRTTYAIEPRLTKQRSAASYAVIVDAALSGDRTISNRPYYIDATRLLFVLTSGSELPRINTQGEIGVFAGETKLNAWDFWMRYPDYLADELIEQYDKTGDDDMLARAEQIFIDSEPDQRRLAMIRYRYGAYEKHDDALAILVSAELIGIGGRKDVDRVIETDFLIYQKAFDLCVQIVRDEPILTWYRDRANLVKTIADGRGGSALKKRQYERVDYAKTLLGGEIPSIDADVKQRLERRLKRPVGGTAA